MMPNVALTRKFKKKLLLWGMGDLTSDVSQLKPVETKDVEIAFEGDTVEQEKDGTQWGAPKKYRTTDKVKITGKIAFAGSGVPGTPPAYRELFLLSGHSETVDSKKSVTYTPQTENLQKGTVAFLLDGQFHMGKDAQVEFKLTANAGEIGYWEFEIKMVGGTIPSPKPEALKTAVEGFKVPKAVNFTNTPLFQLAGLDFPMKGFEHTTGNEITSLDLVNHQSAMISNRKPKVKLTVGALSIEQINLYQKAWNGDEVLLKLGHGTQPGEKITLEYPAISLDIPTATDLDGALGYELDCQAMNTQGAPYKIIFA